MKKSVILFCVFLQGVMLSACSLLTPLPAPSSQVYTLAPAAAVKNDVRYAQNASAQQQQITLLVAMPKAHPEYRDKAMIYAKHQYKIERFSQHRWIDRPARLLQPLIVQGMNNSPKFHAVVASPFVGRSDYRLETEIVDFRQEFFGSGSQFKMTILAYLIDAKSQRVIASRQFSRTKLAADNNPRAGVVAANAAVSELLPALEQFVSASV